MASQLPVQTAPECPLCDGTGWKTLEIPGKASRVTRCECRIDGRAERLLRAARIPPRYQACTLASFESLNDSLVNALWAARRFVEDYPMEKMGMLLVGPIGVGKTHLAVGVIQELIRSKGISCLFCDYRELLKEIQNSYNPSVQTTELEVLRPVFDTEVLVLDELGAVRPTEWVWDTVSHVLNYRYNEKKTTIVTTNFPDQPPRKEPGPRKSFSQSEQARIANAEETLGDRVTERMRSRLHETCRVSTLEGMDFRTLGTSHKL